MPLTVPMALPVYAATSDPGAANDNTQGYVAGSVGINTNTGEAFFARSVATGAAVWLPTRMGGSQVLVAGNWYLPPESPLNGTLTPAGSASAASATMYLVPVVFQCRCTISQLGIYINTGVASTKCQLAIYGSNAGQTRPSGNVLRATGDITTTASTTAVSGALSGGNVQVEPGKVYWLAFCNNSATVVIVGYIGSIGGGMCWRIGSTTLGNVLANQVSLTGVTVASQTYGTWPDLTSASFTEKTNISPGIAFNPTSVP